MSFTWSEDDFRGGFTKPFLGDPLEIYYHDYALGRRLEVMAHWKLLPSQLKELSDEELEIMSFSFRLYEKRNIENLSDIIGTLTGTSWSVEGLTSEVNPDLKDTEFTWSKRPERQRISMPLSLVIGGNKVLDHVKSQAYKVKEKRKENPSILSLPSNSVLENAEIVDLSQASKEEFLAFFEKVETRI